MYLEDSEYDYIVDELRRAVELLDKIEKDGYVCRSIQAKEDNHMAQITSGSVCIEDGLKKSEEYAPPRKVSVTLNFGVVEGEDFNAVFDLASQAAANRVHSLLHGTAIRVVAAPEAPAADALPVEPAARKRRRTAAEIAADNALALAAHPKGDPSAVEDPAAIGEEPPLDSGDPTSGGADPAGLDDFSIEPEETGDEPITDAALNAAVQRKNAELGDPEAIRGVIKLYNPDPTKAFQLREIPQDKRADFITKLGGLTKASA